MNKEILISATDLKKYFPVHKFMSGKQYVKAVDGVSLEINKGDFWSGWRIRLWKINTGTYPDPYV